MDEPLIINAALTGNVPTPDDTPHLPITPEAIAKDAKACAEAGATIVHVHARDADGRPTWDPAITARTLRRVRAAAPDLIVCGTTSGRIFPAIDQRAAVLGLEGDGRPDMASLTLGSMNFAREASVNAPDTIIALAGRMRAAGIRPELEVFGRGMAEHAGHLLRKGVLEAPLYANILLGSRGTLNATARNLVDVVEALPEGTTWAATGIGRSQFPINRLAIAMGGHVRVGLEDNLWMDDDRKELATNAAMVRRVADVARAMDRPIATPTQVRSMLGIPAASGVTHGRVR